MEGEVQKLDELRVKTGALTEDDVEVLLELANNNLHSLKIRLILSNTLSPESTKSITDTLSSYLTRDSSSSCCTSAFNLTALLLPLHPDFLSVHSQLRTSLANAFKASTSSRPSKREELDALAHVASAIAPLPSSRSLLRSTVLPWVEEHVLGPPVGQASISRVEDEDERNAVSTLTKVRAALTVVILRLSAQADLSSPPADGEDGQWPLASLTDLLVSFLTPTTGDATLLTTLEALAYLTLSPSEKTSILKSLISPSALLSLPQNLPSLAYPLSTLLSNLFTFPRHSLLQLPSTPETKLESKLSVNARITSFIEHPTFVPALVKLASLPSSSDSTKTNLSKVILNISEEKSNRPSLVQGGMPKALLYLISSLTPPPPEAIQSISKLLITTDPSLIFNPTILPSVAKALVTPLSPSPVSSSPLATATEDDSGIQLLRQFEALLALTNIASCSEKLAAFISSLSLPSNSKKPFIAVLITEHLLSTNVLIRRATTELICNLSSTPSCLSYFSKPSNRSTLDLLLALCSSTDLPTRLASSGALATLAGCSTDIAQGISLEKLVLLLEEEEIAKMEAEEEKDEEGEEDVRERIWATVLEVVSSRDGRIEGAFKARVLTSAAKESGRLKDLVEEVVASLK